MTSITPFLWFDNNVPEAVAFYKSVFPNAKVETVNDFTATFELEGQRFNALNGGPKYKFNEAISFFISVEGTFRVPVTINNELTVKFVIDSGAAVMSVPADVVMTLFRTGTITDADFLGKQTYQLADGSTVPSQQFLIRTLKVGDATLENVVGSIAPVAGGLLLGQSFLSRFNTWSIDNHRQALILGSPPNNDVGAAPDAPMYKPVAPYNTPPVVLNPPPPAPGYGEPVFLPGQPQSEWRQLARAAHRARRRPDHEDGA